MPDSWHWHIWNENFLITKMAVFLDKKQYISADRYPLTNVHSVTAMKTIFMWKATRTSKLWQLCPQDVSHNWSQTSSDSYVHKTSATTEVKKALTVMSTRRQPQLKSKKLWQLCPQDVSHNWSQTSSDSYVHKTSATTEVKQALTVMSTRRQPQLDEGLQVNVFNGSCCSSAWRTHETNEHRVCEKKSRSL
jgi:hypothetical protein